MGMHTTSSRRVIKTRSASYKKKGRTASMGHLNRSAMGSAHIVKCATPAIDKTEVVKLLGQFSGVLKLYIGACNNATYIVLGNAYDAMRKHPVFKQKFHKARGKFNQAIKEWKSYEHHLIYDERNRMFHLADFPPETRKKYGNISDQEYYDYWCSVGSFAYDFSIDMLNSLKHKYRKALDENNVEGAEYLSEALLCLTCLNVCDTMLDVHLDRGVEYVGVPKAVLEDCFGGFSLKRVRDCWYQGLKLTIPDFIDTDLGEQTDRNIEIGIRQLAERWADEKMLYHAVNDATEDWQEVFRTPGEWKKALKSIHETRKTLE